MGVQLAGCGGPVSEIRRAARLERRGARPVQLRGNHARGRIHRCAWSARARRPRDKSMSLSTAHDPPAPALTRRGIIRAAGFIGLGAIGVVVGLSDVLARAPADDIDFGMPLTAPDAHFPLGTDVLGRDMLSETLHALTVTVTNAGIAAVIVVIAGGLLGFIAARLPWRAGFA